MKDSTVQESVKKEEELKLSDKNLQHNLSVCVSVVINIMKQVCCHAKFSFACNVRPATISDGELCEALAFWYLFVV